MKLFNLRSFGSGIVPEETPPKFFARHFSAYHFALPYLKEKDILEIGFGDGYGSNFLAGYAKSVKAIDFLKKKVELASNKYKRPNLEFIEMDAVSLQFADESFDGVVSFQVIEHLPEDRLVKYLKGIRRILKKGGIAFISTLNLEKNRKPNKVYSKNRFHIKEFTYGEFDSLIKEVFDRCEVYGLFYTSRLRFYERLKKIGFYVSRFYNNITVNDFVWKREDLRQCIDFMATCRKI